MFKKPKVFFIRSVRSIQLFICYSLTESYKCGCEHKDEQIAFRCSLCPVLELHLGYVGAVH